jgi:hypothetical protein
MIDFLKRLYKKRSNVPDPLAREIWSIAASSRDDVSLQQYRKWLCEEYNFSERDIDSYFAVYCHQIPNDNGKVSWNEDIKSYSLNLGIPLSIFEKTNNDYTLAMMFRAHVRLLSKSQFDPDGELAARGIKRLEIYISLFEEEIKGLEYEDVIKSFGEFEDRVEKYVVHLGGRLEELDFEKAAKSYLKFKRLESSINSTLSTKGTDKDELPNGVGEFGLEATNPIPVASIREGYDYLEKLSTASGEVSYLRIRSIGVDNISGPVDEYQIYLQDTELCKVYLNAYNRKTSIKIPRGFIWKS